MNKFKSLIPNCLYILPVAVLAVAGGCAPAIHVRTDYSHTTDFANYHTYSWLKVQAGNSLWNQRVRRAVDEQLAARGWVEVPSGGQAAVAAFAASHERPTLETFYSGFGPGYGGWYWGGFGWNTGMATTQVVYTPIGSLVVDIFNNNTRHLIWRSVSTQALSSKPRKNEARLDRAVAKMFRTFPPTSLG